MRCYLVGGLRDDLLIGGLKMQRVSEALKLPVVVERGWSLVLKRQCAQKGECF